MPNRPSDYYRERAAEARRSAEEMMDKVAVRAMLDIAQRYDLMARIAAQKEARMAAAAVPHCMDRRPDKR